MEYVACGDDHAEKEILENTSQDELQISMTSMRSKGHLKMLTKQQMSGSYKEGCYSLPQKSWEKFTADNVSLVTALGQQHGKQLWRDQNLHLEQCYTVATGQAFQR